MMEAFERLDAIAVPMAVENIDTDQIVPVRFTRRARADGFADSMFHDLRFDKDERALPNFVLNQPEWDGARIIVALRNFGCGSSRECAVYALWDYGFRAAIAPSFGDIFYSNALQNGFLPIVLPEAQIRSLIATLQARPGTHVAVDLAGQTVTGPDGAASVFDIDPFRKTCLLQGVDEIGFTLSQDDRITAFEQKRRAERAWM